MRVRRALPIAALIVGVLTSACSSFRFINSMVPPGNYERTTNIPYAVPERHKLDVYVPRAAGSDRPKPVVVFFYGGGWVDGDRGEYLFVGEALASQGFVAVIPDYRVHPEALFPNFVRDGAKAVRWVKDNIASFGGDPRQLFIMGHSAGAHLAALLTLDRQYLNAVGMAPLDLRGTIGLSGPYVYPYFPTKTNNAVFGPESGRWRSQPINFVDGHNPPMLLATGANDGIANPGNTRLLAARITAHGGPVEVVEYPDIGHADLIARLAAPLRGDGEILQRVARFVLQHSDID
jgi:acetyl esterase/lipase